MKQYKIFMTAPATDDLQDIVSYISKEIKEPVIAQKLLGKIRGAIMSLADMPVRHALVSDQWLAHQGIRRLMVDNYIVFYVVSAQDGLVTIIRILYGKRDWLNLL